MNPVRHLRVTLLPIMAAALIVAPAAHGQGCSAIRTSIPMMQAGIGDDSGYLQKGDLQLNLSLRNLTSDKHYNLDERQYIRELLKNNVTVHQRQYTAGATYAWSDRWNLTATIPVVDNSWAINPRPGFFTGDGNTPDLNSQINLVGDGLGDINFIARYWLADPKRNHSENLSLGMGVKLPTGNEREQVTTTDFAGRNPRPRFVDISAQPGDGGLGLLFDIAAFKQVDKSTWTFNFNYLANPKDTNGTPSILNTLGIPPSLGTSNLQVNSVPDAYIARLGVLYPIGKKGLALSAAYRIEGSPRNDLFGSDNGFRRPGYETFFEPGVLYASGAHAFSLNVPIAHHRFRGLNSTVNPATGVFDRGDATFPDYIVMANYSYRFGFGKHKDRSHDMKPSGAGSQAIPQVPVIVPAGRVGG